MAVTLNSLSLRKEQYLSVIKDYEKEIENAKQKIAEIDSEIQRLTAYENSPIESRTLSVYIHDQTKTVKLFDQFDELTPEGYYRYSRMLIRNSEYYNGCIFDLIVERLGDRKTVGDITMTEFKKGEKWHLREYIEQELKKHKKYAVGDTVYFSKPFLLRAQNSKNRSGYGSMYNGDTLVYEGTLYGETTNYGFVGAICSYI